MSTKKGRLLEKVVAGLHIAPGLTVQTNVLMPTLHGGKRRREIDILITGSLSGYQIRLAFECKNETKPVGVPYIDGFLGKLDDVGIPHQHGIFVSTSRYTDGAVSRAEELSIKTYLFQGLTSDGLSEAITEAIQSVVYLLLDVREFSFIKGPFATDNPCPRQMPPIFKVEKKGKVEDEGVVASIHDLIWREWTKGRPTSIIGEHELALSLPETWKEEQNGVFTPIQSVAAKVHIIGLVLTVQGEAREHSLINARDHSLEKKSINLAFGGPEAKVAIHNVHSEVELENLLAKTSNSALVVGRVRIPRIKIFSPVGYIYYPYSETTVNKLIGIAQSFSLEGIQDAEDVDAAQIEGQDFQKLWEPIWHKYPVAKILGTE